jgi:hypothetical protein
VIIFYATIFLIFLIVIAFIYVSYSYKIRKFTFTWPIQVLRVAFLLITTILFIPILGMLALLFILFRVIPEFIVMLNGRRSPCVEVFYRS